MSGRERTKATAHPVSKEKEQMNRTAKPAKLRKRGPLAAILAALALSIAAFAPSASAEFGLSKFDVQFNALDSTPEYPLDDPPATQAGSHPFAVTTHFEVNYHQVEGEPFPLNNAADEPMKEMLLEQIAGLSGDLTAVPRCKIEGFLANKVKPECADNTVVGIAAIAVGAPPPFFYNYGSIYNIDPPPGVAARLAFYVGATVPQIVDITVKPGGDYNVVGKAARISQLVAVIGGAIQLWGVPADPVHDSLRGADCLGRFSFGKLEFPSTGDSCPAGVEPRPFLNLPGSCVGPVETRYRTASWPKPDVFLEGGSLSHDDATPPNPVGFSGCGKLGFSPELKSTPTSDSAETGTGLDVDVDFRDEGLKNPDGLLESQAKKAEVILPEGVTINPSVGEGLGVCTPEQLEAETLHSDPGEGCPNSSKVGTLNTTYDIIDEPIDGSIFLAEQDDPTTAEPGAENPFDSLIALYFVLRNENLGVIVKLPVLVEPDPDTGQIVVTLDDIPQFPFAHFNAHLREGVRSALVTPPTCGTHTTEARLYPHSEPDNPRVLHADFRITRGTGGGECPPGGIPPFNPGFEAGSLNNNAGSFSPFNMKLTRADGDQDLTRFSSVLPPGELGSLAGVEKCSEAAIEAARTRTGTEENASPSCPANSLIGHTLAGAGVGSALTYVKGYLYLGGPYKGAPLSVVSITPALAGPFDAGTVVVRLGLTLNPKTAEVEVDGAASDPIPHILKGIVLKVRDLRVYVDRPNFTLNPTSCDESSARATVFGSYRNVFDPADDVPVDLSTRFQAANCLNLAFKPNLRLNLKGGTKRGGHPGLRANYTPKPGHANIEDLVVRLPRSAFLDQAHIKTICTRVQFAAESCPKRARYGYIKAWTPLLDEPLQGPVWLRSSNHKLPDLIFDLHGLVDIEVSVRIDSARGGIRATLTDAPDAPLSRVLLRMQGGKKGLIINSRDLCAGKSRANVRATGHNGKPRNFNPLMRPLNCAKKRKRGKRSVARVARSSVAG